jgi:hypothetical protein
LIFDAILKELAEVDWFIKKESSPSLFVVYAHDNDAIGKANAAAVIQLIQWFKRIRARILSDLSPIISAPNDQRDIGDAALHDIVKNQLCLLPEWPGTGDIERIGRVDTAILFYSDVLKQYSADPRMGPYMLAIENIHENGIESGKVWDDVEPRVHETVRQYRAIEGFHHVLTELAFLNIRTAYEGTAESIVPVILSGEIDGVQSLPCFHFGETVLLKTKDSDTEIRALQNLHTVFFKLLRRIYPRVLRGIEAFDTCYKKCTVIFSSAIELPSKETLAPILKREIEQAHLKWQSDNRAFSRSIPLPPTSTRKWSAFIARQYHC